MLHLTISTRRRTLHGSSARIRDLSQFMLAQPANPELTSAEAIRARLRFRQQTQSTATKVRWVGLRLEQALKRVTSEQKVQQRNAFTRV